LSKINTNLLLRKPAILIAVLFLHLFLVIKLHYDSVTMRSSDTSSVQRMTLFTFIPAQKTPEIPIPSPVPPLNAEQKTVMKPLPITRRITTRQPDRPAKPTVVDSELQKPAPIERSTVIANTAPPAQAAPVENGKTGNAINYASIKNVAKAVAHDMETQVSPVTAVNGEINRKITRDEKFANEIKKAGREDCLNKFQGYGLLAPLFVVSDALNGKGKGCKY
jgi:hypothetical protein